MIDATNVEVASHTKNNNLENNLGN